MITIRLEGIKEAMEKYNPATVRRAARAAIDRATKSGKSIASEEIRKDWNVKKSDLDPRIRTTPPRIDDLRGEISITGKSMSLSYFGARQISGATVRSRVGNNLKTGRVTRGMKAAGPLPSGVVVQILKGKDTVLLRNAFMAKVKSGKKGASHIGVFRRSTNKRLPIYEKNVISVASMAAKPEVLRRVTDRIIERWQVEFPRQMEYFLSRGAR